MSFDSEALFYQTDLTNWNTSFPVECIKTCPEPPIVNIQRNLIMRNFFSSDKLMQQYAHKKSNKYPWKMELSPDGQYIVILKNNNIELRSPKLDFNHINFHCQIYRDLYPQWRCVAWSNQSNYFGVTFSNGMCNIWDIQGSRLVLKHVKTNDFDPVIKLIIRNITKGKIKIYILTLKGKIIIYIIQDFKITNTFQSNIDFLTSPILCSEILDNGNFLVLGTYSQYHINDAFQNGIISCRLIDEYPYIIPNVNINSIYRRKQTWFYNLFGKKSVDAIYNMQISKDNNKLAALHISGVLSIWLFPSLSLVIKWQSTSILTNKILTTDFINCRVMPSNCSDTSIVHICWWNSELVVIALQNGRIIVMDPQQSENGNIYLHPFPEIQESIDKSFYALNCVAKSTNSEISPSIEKMPASLFWRSIINIVSYFTQDSNDLSTKKSLDMCSLNFQLSCFKLTTPEELFDIQINKKQYTEALKLANKYDLDVDIVFQKQWRDSKKSIDDIENILIKISKRNWILNECIQRIPDEIDSLKCLLRLGLQLTSFDELTNDNEENNNIGIDKEYLHVDCNRQTDIDEEIDVNQLNLIQTELIRMRFKLLSYCDKLSMYENMISVCGITFQREVFTEFKNLSPFELGLSFANSGNIVALQVLFDFYHIDLLQHILTILTNIPESVEPKLYRILFDYIPIFDDKRKISDEKLQIKQLDWCEKNHFVNICQQISSVNESVENYYQNHVDQSQLILMPNANWLQIFTNWLDSRIRNIEYRTLNAEYALQLLKIGQKLNISIDKNLEFNLRFLCEAIYSCQISNTFVSLSEFELLSHVDKAKLLMSKTDPNRFLVHFVHWIIPMAQEIYCQSAEKSLNFFQLYLQEVGSTSLICARKILDDKNCCNTILKMVDFCDFIHIYLTILFNDDESININECSKIVQLLTDIIADKNTLDPNELLSEQSQLKDITNYIVVLRMMEKYELHKTIKFIHSNKMNGELVENFITNMLYKYLKTVKQLNKIIIKSVFMEIQMAISLVFKSIHPKLIYKNLLKSLLESGEKKKINLASEFMDLTRKLSLVNDVNNEDKLLDFHEACNCIVTVSQNYINSSTSSKDKNFILAKYCLNLIQDPQKDIDKELNLIKCCEFINKYNCNLVPIEVRGVGNKFQLLKTCLDGNKSLYRNLEEIVEVGTYLCSDKAGNKKYHEGEALRLLVDKAIENNDMEILEIVMASLIYRDHRPCWKECIQCIKNPQFPIDRKHELGKYAITYCPKSALYDTVKLIKIIEIEAFNFEKNISNESEQSISIDSNTNSNLIKQPMKFISSGIFISDISSKLSLKSLIDKSSDTLMKLSNQMIQLSSQNTTNQEFYNNSDKNNLNKLYFNLIYQKNGSFENDSNYNELIKMFNLCNLLSTIQKQSDIDEMHMKLLKCNLNRDTYLSIIHSIFIDNIDLIYDLRNDLTPNLFNRALILSMIELNIIFKYTFEIPWKNIIKFELQSLISSIQSQISPHQLSVLQSMKQEYQDYYLYNKIESILPDISIVKLISSVDYRRTIVNRLSEFCDDTNGFQYCLKLCDRYEINRQIISMKYFISFLTKADSLDKTNFENYFTLFQSNFNWECLMTDENALRKDLELFFNPEFESNRIKEFRTMLQIIDRVHYDNFILFDRSINNHLLWIELYDSIFIDTSDCSYLDLVSGYNQQRIIESLKCVINTDNLESCSKLMEEFHLSQQFAKIKKDFSVVLANQSFWSKDNLTENNEIHFNERFVKSLTNFSLSDYNNCKDFLYSTLFERNNSYINLERKIDILKLARTFINDKCNGNHNEDIVTKWSQVDMEITIWMDHIDNTVSKVIKQLQVLTNISHDVIKIAEYLPPENYWDCLMNEMLLSNISYQDFFTFTWELNIEPIIVEEAIGAHISHITLSKYIPNEGIIEKLSQIFDELDEFIDCNAIENIISTILSLSTTETSSIIIHWLLNEVVYRMRQNKSPINIDMNKYIVAIINQWNLNINNKLQISNSNNLFIIDALIQDCNDPDGIELIGQVIELIELIHEDNNLWQCWVKSCVIKGPEYSDRIFEQFQRLKTNRLYNNRFAKLIKDAVQSLIAFRPSDAISLLILNDPIESSNQIQDILINLKSDPIEYANTMKNINGKSLQIIVDRKLVPLYAKTILFQRLVNFITKDSDDPNIVQDVLEQLKQNGLRDEATWLASSSSHINPAMKTIEMVSGFWKKFSSGGGT